MRNGVRLALDWGAARIGVAACDPEGLLAYPVRTVAAGASALDQVRGLVADYRPIEVLVGLPRTLGGTEGLAATTIRAQAVSLAAHLPGVAVRLVDERLTTVAASRRLRAAGRSARRQRAVIDQAAAVALLEQALDHERATGRPPGELLGAADGTQEGHQ